MPGATCFSMIRRRRRTSLRVLPNWKKSPASAAVRSRSASARSDDRRPRRLAAVLNREGLRPGTAQRRRALPHRDRQNRAMGPPALIARFMASAAGLPRCAPGGPGRRRGSRPRVEKNRSSSSASCSGRSSGMALDIGVELGRGERAADHVAFELGHVDAVGGEAAQRLVERRRHVAHRNTKVVTVGPLRARRAFGSRDMTRKRVVLCSASSMFCASDYEAVDLAGQLRGDRRDASDRRAPRPRPRAAGGVGMHDRLAARARG